MVLGMSLQAFTSVHVIISLIAIDGVRLIASPSHSGSIAQR